MNHKNNGLAYVIIYLFLLFADIPETYIPYFNYWDEVLVLVCLGLLIYRTIISGRVKKNSGFHLIGIICIIVIGLIGNVLHPGIQEDKSAIFRDIFALLKFFIVIYTFENKRIDVYQQEALIKKLAKISKVLVYFTVALALVTYPLNTLLYTGETRITKCFTFFFSHPTFFVSSYVMILAVLIADSINKNRFAIIADLLLIFLAQRTKGYIVIAITVVMLIIGEAKARQLVRRVFSASRRKIGKQIALLGFFITIAWVIGKQKISLYLSWGLAAARPALYIVGLGIASDFFPFGSGFGTFATSISVRSYSNIYDMYGISGVLGLSRDYYGFAGDVFWPAIFGELGLIGFCIYVKSLISVVRNQIRNTFNDKVKIALMILWSYALFASLVEAYFSNSSGVQFAFVSCFILGAGHKMKGNIHGKEV